MAVQVDSDLKCDLHRVAGWCCFNRLLINPKKTKLLFEGRQLLAKVPDDISIQFLGEALKPSTSIKDLGLIFD